MLDEAIKRALVLETLFFRDMTNGPDLEQLATKHCRLASRNRAIGNRMDSQPIDGVPAHKNGLV